MPGAVVHLDIEHHANLLPWQARGARAAGARAVRARAVEARATLPETLRAVRDELARTPAALLAVTGASNVTGECLPLIDYLAFSGHKIYAPFGAGVLVGRGDWLDAAPPYLAGGGASARWDSMPPTGPPRPRGTKAAPRT